ncbi:MAG: hypothetical protein DRG63_08020 [Deltaproteobacteria bacterium]|nr:MAG: hypothetical protein DRG63_08020 [Deltaproteobacteria bacterium]
MLFISFYNQLYELKHIEASLFLQKWQSRPGSIQKSVIFQLDCSELSLQKEMELRRQEPEVRI